MTDDNKEHQEQEQQQGKTFTEAEVQALIQKEIGALKAKNDELIGEKRAEAEKKRLAEEEAKRLAEEQARKNGDLEAIENSWREKHENAVRELTDKYEKERAKTLSLTVGVEVSDISGRLAKASSKRLLSLAIENRIVLDSEGNKRYLDRDFKPTAWTREEFENDVKNDVSLQDIIVINNASGSGASGGGSGGGAALDLKSMTMQQKREWLERDPVGFNQAVKNQI